MINRINKIKSKNPKLRKIFNIIFSLFNEVLILSYIAMIVLALLMIIVPTAIVFWQSPEDVRVWIASIVGGILSVVVVPIFINYITDKRKTEDELRKTLFEENKALYAKLSNILVELLVNESSIHKENTNSNIKAEKSLNVVSPLKDFLKDNYSELANTISISLIWDIVEVCQECSNSVTAYDNIRVKTEKCFRNIRKEIGVKGKFYVNDYIINEFCDSKKDKDI